MRLWRVLKSRRTIEARSKNVADAWRGVEGTLLIRDSSMSMPKNHLPTKGVGMHAPLQTVLKRLMSRLGGYFILLPSVVAAGAGLYLYLMFSRFHCFFLADDWWVVVRF